MVAGGVQVAPVRQAKAMQPLAGLHVDLAPVGLAIVAINFLVAAAVDAEAVCLFSHDVAPLLTYDLTTRVTPEPWRDVGRCASSAVLSCRV